MKKKKSEKDFDTRQFVDFFGRPAGLGMIAWSLAQGRWAARAATLCDTIDARQGATAAESTRSNACHGVRWALPPMTLGQLASRPAGPDRR